MAKTTSFGIGDPFNGFVEQQEASLAVFRAALIEAEQTGAATPFDFGAVIVRKRAALG